MHCFHLCNNTQLLCYTVSRTDMFKRDKTHIYIRYMLHIRYKLLCVVSKSLLSPINTPSNLLSLLNQPLIDSLLSSLLAQFDR